MEEAQLTAVLEFLRKNRLSECESALMEDVLEKSQLGSSELEKFFFPMVPPPPPLRIPAARQLPDGGGSSRGGSSDDEFVSLGSSTTELCSSDFTNPYGVHTTRPSSQSSSSDRLSQFGTARDYPDFDMQNDLFWYRERDEDYLMPPLFSDQDFDGDPSEDKFVTNVDEPTEDRSPFNLMPCGAYKDYYELAELFRLEQRDEKHEEHSIDHIYYKMEKSKVDDVNDGRLMTLGERLAEKDSKFSVKRISADDWGRVVDDDMTELNMVNEDGHHNENDDYDFMYGDVIAGGKEEGGTISDELLVYDKEHDYEVFELRIIHRKNRTGFEESKEFPIVINSVVAAQYYVTEYLGSAAFSKVVQAHDICTGMDVCLKIIKNDKDFFDQSLDEIKLLKFVNMHDPADQHHILRLYDYFYYQEHLFIVTELLRANLYEFQKYNQESGAEPYFTLHRLQVITRQCLEALIYLHGLGIMHCDLKPENILIKSYRRCEIKVIDLGSSCFQTDNLSFYVQSRSYRAPEVILGLPYDQKIDLWSLGCILAELCSGEVLFPNEHVAMLLARMVGVLGPIDMDMLKKGQETSKYFTKEYDLYYMNEDTNEIEYIVPEETTLEQHLQISDSGFIHFLKYLLQINPKRRPTAREALQHPWLSCQYEVNSAEIF